ncbi:MAG: hypothetical protein ACKOPP_04600 [Bacteroidota bacterium]
MFRLSFGLLLGLMLLACQNSSKEEQVLKEGTPKDTVCSPGLEQPKASPMAAAMRAMADQAETMRAWILRDSLNKDARPTWAPMPFETQRPTDTSVLTQDFFEAAKAYQLAHQLVQKQPTKEHFNAFVSRCIACHQSHCPGPLKRINRLKIAS